MQAYLLLADGQLLPGELHGAAKEARAELVFTTGMGSYLETLTDPSYEGQIVVQTFPTIGNYGVIPADFESDGPRLAGYIARELCEQPSNFRCEGPLEAYLQAQGIPCLTGIDTRALTRKLRSAGVMNAAILLQRPEDIAAEAEKLRRLPFHPAISEVTVPAPVETHPGGRYRVVLWDFGAKANIRRELE